MKLILLLLCCLHMPNLFANEDTVPWYALKKISCYGEHLKLWLPFSDFVFPEKQSVQLGFSVNGNSKILDVKTFTNDNTSKYWGINNTIGTGFGAIIRTFNSDDLNNKYEFNVGFSETKPTNLTYSQVFGERDGIPCDMFDANNCSLCSLPKEKLFICEDRSLIQKKFRCNGEYDCDDNSDESINGANSTCHKCSGNKAELITSYLICDGLSDCTDGSDESINGANPTCHECSGNKTELIASYSICDGISDCADGSDESINGTNPTCHECSGNKKELIASYSICDGISDCADGSDEGSHCSANTDAYATGAAGAAILASCVAYMAMLVKYKKLKTDKNTIKWLLSPFTEPVKYLLRYSGYLQAEQADKSNQNDNTDT